MPLPRRKPSPEKAISKGSIAKKTLPSKWTAKKATAAARPAKKSTPFVSSSGAKKSTTVPKRSAMATRRAAPVLAQARTVKQYEHPTKKRLNNPPVGLVTPETDPDLAPKTYAYDPHLDPQLVWTGKEEKPELTVETVSLHVHERIDPYSIIEAVRTGDSFIEQPSLFSKPAENPPLREAVDFYKHKHDWSNRLIAGDSLLVMNSLLEREGMAGQVQMVYIDPPYGIKYRSNFQPFTTQRDVEEKDKDLTQEPEMIRAFRDTWELGVHSYLTYLRDRLALSRNLLADEGSCFIQISDENLHRVRAVADEIFGAAHFVCVINFVTANAQTGRLIENNCNYLIWYAKNKEKAKFRPLFLPKTALKGGLANYRFVELPDGTRRGMSREEFANPDLLPIGSRIFRADKLTSSHPPGDFPVEFDNRTWHPKKGYWSTGESGMASLRESRRLIGIGETLCYLRYIDDFPAYPIGSQWNDTMTSGFSSDKVYVVQTSSRVVERCVLMTTDPGDIVFDPTCGSGTTAVVAEQWGRRWITCDTSRVAITLAKKRLMTASYQYYELADDNAGISSGFQYKAIPHITLKSIANKDPSPQETLYDQPVVNRDKMRVTGPFTVEAVPAPMVAEMSTDSESAKVKGVSVSRSGATQRQSDWRAELLKGGARAHGGAAIKFSRVEPLAGTRYLHAEAETIEDTPRRVVISFGPEYQPLDQRQVEVAWGEARTLDPRPDIVLFAAFQFDPEAAKDIDEMPAAATKKTLFLRAQMNADLLTDDLKKKRASNQSFWLVGRPDVEVVPTPAGTGKNGHQVIVHGFDYYDVKTGEIESGGVGRIAMWMLDPDYDGRSIFPRQVFFPNSGDKDGWGRLAKTLRAELDEELLEAYRGTRSLPFSAGKHGRIAVKIVDNRGIESLRVMDLP
jgi:adenine-specific DNA-methyltransferase